ncbi:MAG: prolyl-tRNA synthetase associated domain-containing protein [Caulobacteraceae bacterium]
MTDNEKKVYDALNQLEIPFVRYEHIPVYTIQEANDLNLEMEGKLCKNLFVRNLKGNKHYLILVSHEKRTDLKGIASQVGSSRLSFASEERLLKYLGLTPGSVTPFGLLNDEEKNVTVLIDEDLKNSDFMCFHPNINTVSISISYGNFEKFLRWCGNPYSYVHI